jgi:hypothetical protein
MGIHRPPEAFERTGKKVVFNKQIPRLAQLAVAAAKDLVVRLVVFRLSQVPSWLAGMSRSKP